MTLLSQYYHLPLETCHQQLLLNQVPTLIPIQRRTPVQLHAQMVQLDARTEHPVVNQEIIAQTQACQQVYTILREYVQHPIRYPEQMLIQTIAINTMINITYDEFVICRITKRHKCGYYIFLGTLVGAILSTID